MLTGLQQIYTTLFYLINRDGQAWLLNWLMPFVSNEKNFYIPIVVLWLYMVLRPGIRCRVVALAMIALIGLSEWVSSDLLKPAFNRPRPFHGISYVHLYDRMFKTWTVTGNLDKVIYNQSRSLPSSHATNIFAAAFFLSWYFRPWWPLCFLVALMVGYSRVYLGVHYPFDVLAGAIAGTLCALVLIWPTDRAIAWFENRRTPCPEP